MPVGLVRTRNNAVINIRKLEGCNVLWSGMRNTSHRYSSTIHGLSYEFQMHGLCKDCPKYVASAIPF